MRSNHPLLVISLHFISSYGYIFILYMEDDADDDEEKKRRKKKEEIFISLPLFSIGTMRTEIETKRRWEEKQAAKKKLFYCLCLLGVYCILLLLLHFLLSSFSSFLACLVFAFAIPIPTIIYTNKISEINICIVCT